MNQLIECVPNFSEGCNQQIIQEITNVICSVKGIRLLNVEPGEAANRTVVTFAGSPSEVFEAAFNAVGIASQLIDMSLQNGEHPRIGATDVVPLVPLSNITMEEVVEIARRLAEKIGCELDIPVYCYEYAAFEEKRRSLANCRRGEYEGLPQKLINDGWKPDFGPSNFTAKVAKTGATIIGARKILIAYNVNLNTNDVNIAKEIASQIRGKGKFPGERYKQNGKLTKNNGKIFDNQTGLLQSVKALGWYIAQYGFAQVSCNLTDYSINPMHQVYELVSKLAKELGAKVTGSELIGLVPLEAIIESGRYFLNKGECRKNASEDEIIKAAISGLGLDQLSSFNQKGKIIESCLNSG